MEGVHQRPVGGGPIKQPPLRGQRPLGEDVKNGTPVWFLQMDRMQRRIGQVEQLVAGGSDGQGYLSWRMAGRGDGVDAGYDLFLSVDEIEVAPDRRQAPARERGQPPGRTAELCTGTRRR
jgi:hypothetical protein